MDKIPETIKVPVKKIDPKLIKIHKDRVKIALENGLQKPTFANTIWNIVYYAIESNCSANRLTDRSRRLKALTPLTSVEPTIDIKKEFRKMNRDLVEIYNKEWGMAEQCITHATDVIRNFIKSLFLNPESEEIEIFNRLVDYNVLGIKEKGDKVNTIHWKGERRDLK